MPEETFLSMLAQEIRATTIREAGGGGAVEFFRVRIPENIQQNISQNLSKSPPNKITCCAQSGQIEQRNAAGGV